MPFGVSWGLYTKMWAVSIAGFACGSQLVHSQYKPLDNLDLLVKQEVDRLREARNLKKPTAEDKLKKLLALDEEYIEKFYVNAKKPKKDES